MGYTSPQVGYEGYIVSNDILVEDTTEYSSFGGAGYTTKITGSILTDVSSVSKFRFKVSLKHSIIGQNVEIRVSVGGKEIWYEKHTAPDVNYHIYTKDIAVTWHRGDNIEVKVQASANTGFNKDLQICGKVSPLRLD